VIVHEQNREQVQGIQQAPPWRPDLPCAALPTRLIMEDPICAQKLLTVMNVTNVHILTNISQLPDLDPAIKEQLAKLGMSRSWNHSRGGYS